MLLRKGSDRAPVKRWDEYDLGGSEEDSEGELGQERASDRILEDDADAVYAARDSWYVHPEDEGGGAAAPPGAAAAPPPPPPPHHVLQVNLADPVPSLMISDPAHELPSAELLKKTATLLMHKIREYFLPIFVTLEKLVVDLDALEDKQLGVMKNIMMQYTAQGLDPMDHLSPGMEIEAALVVEGSFDEDLEEIYEKQETVIHMVETAKPAHHHFLRKLSKLRLQTMAYLDQDFSSPDKSPDILYTTGCIPVIGDELHAMYTECPHVCGLLWKLHLAATYRVTIEGGFKHMYTSYVRLEIASLRRKTEAEGGDERLPRTSRDGRATNAPALSQEDLQRLNQEEATGAAGTDPPTGDDEGAGRAEYDGIYQLSDGEQPLQGVWNASAGTTFYFDYEKEMGVLEWARNNHAVIVRYLTANGSVEPVVQSRDLGVDDLSEIMQQSASDGRADKKRNEQGTVRDVALGTAIDMFVDHVLLDDRIAERIAAKKEASHNREALRTQRWKEWAKERELYVTRMLQGKRQSRNRKQSRVALPAAPPPSDVGSSSSAGFGRADATPAPRPRADDANPLGPRKPRAPAPQQNPLPELRPVRAANYQPAQRSIGDTGFITPSDRRVQNPNLVLDAGYYRGRIAEIETFLSDMSTAQAFGRTDEGQDRIRRWALDLAKMKMSQEVNDKKLSGEIPSDPAKDAETVAFLKMDELHEAAHTKLIAQRAAAAAAQEAAEWTLLEAGELSGV
jgi:hypothetical protein